MRTMKYINIPDEALTLAVPPKCGSSSVYDALERHFGVDKLQNCPEVRLLKAECVPCSHRLVFVVRHPLDRFRSLWRNKCRDGGKLAGDYALLRGMSPEALFEFIKVFGNHHWTPQAKMADALPFGPVREFVRVESLSKWWADNTDFPRLLRINTTEDRDYPRMSKELTAAVEDYYRADVRLWEDAL